MPQTINTNIVSLNAQRNLNTSQASMATTMARLSSGLRVNSAKDDAAGLAIAERIQSQVRGLNVAIRNAGDGISLAQVAEGALGRVSDILQRMRELAVQSANGTNSSIERDSLDEEFQQLAEEARRTLNSTSFVGKNVLNSTDSFFFQIGANNIGDDQITSAGFAWTANSSLTNAVGLAAASISGADGTNATASMTKLDAAIDACNSQRAVFGALQNRFENVIANQTVAMENQAAARARIVDADYAAETSNLSRVQILQQAGTAMVAQANASPQLVLQLLQR